MARLNKIQLDGTDYAIGTEYFAICSTLATDNIKAVNTTQTTGFGLNNGTILHVLFTADHTSGNAMQLNVNSTGAKSVRNKRNKSVTYLPRGYYSFVYYNNYWYINGKAFEDLEVAGTGDAITSIDAKDWTNGIKATKGNVEAYFSNKKLPKSLFSVLANQFTGTGTMADFWNGENGSYMSGLFKSGTLDFNNITTASKNRRFYLYMWNPNTETNGFKIQGCYVSDSENQAQQGYIDIPSNNGIILKCSNDGTAWWVEVVRFKKV